MTKGTRVVCKKDGKEGIVTYSYGTANEVLLENGNYRYVLDSGLAPLMFRPTRTVEDILPERFAKESRAGESVAELETLPPPGLPDSIESHSVESVPEQGLPGKHQPEKPLSENEKRALNSCFLSQPPFDMQGRTWRDYYPDWEGTDVNDGPEVEIMKAVRYGFLSRATASVVLSCIGLVRDYDRT